MNKWLVKTIVCEGKGGKKTKKTPLTQVKCIGIIGNLEMDFYLYEGKKIIDLLFAFSRRLFNTVNLK